MAEKTEQPTPKKLRDARRKGQVAKSKEVGSAAILLSLFAVSWLAADAIMQRFVELVLLPTAFMDQPFEDIWQAYLAKVFETGAWLSLPFVATALVAAVTADIGQVGLLFAGEAVKPDPNKLNPANGLKRIVSMDGLIEMTKSVFKIGFLTVLLCLVLRRAVPDLFALATLDHGAVPALVGALLTQIMLYTCAALLIVAVADGFFQRYRHHKKLKMSMDEVKREHKEMEGDPLIKSTRRECHQELLQDEIVAATRQATTVVTNPTHFAAALRYRPGEDPLPMLLAKGRDEDARLIIKTAQAAGIPVLRYVPLARGLFREARVNQPIPPAFFAPVAEVVNWVANLPKPNQQPEVEPAPPASGPAVPPHRSPV